MANHLLEVTVNGKTKYVGHNGKDVYFDNTKGGGCWHLKGLIFSEGEIKDYMTNKILSAYEIGEKIRNYNY